MWVTVIATGIKNGRPSSARSRPLFGREDPLEPPSFLQDS